MHFNKGWCYYPHLPYFNEVGSFKNSRDMELMRNGERKTRFKEEREWIMGGMKCKICREEELFRYKNIPVTGSTIKTCFMYRFAF